MNLLEESSSGTVRQGTSQEKGQKAVGLVKKYAENHSKEVTVKAQLKAQRDAATAQREKQAKVQVVDKERMSKKTVAVKARVAEKLGKQKKLRAAKLTRNTLKYTKEEMKAAVELARKHSLLRLKKDSHMLIGKAERERTEAKRMEADSDLLEEQAKQYDEAIRVRSAMPQAARRAQEKLFAAPASTPAHAQSAPVEAAAAAVAATAAATAQPETKAPVTQAPVLTAVPAVAAPLVAAAPETTAATAVQENQDDLERSQKELAALQAKLESLQAVEQEAPNDNEKTPVPGRKTPAAHEDLVELIRVP